MALPATTASLADDLALLKASASQIKNNALAYQARFAAGPVSADDICTLVNQCIAMKTALAQAGAVPGIGAYAQTQLGLPSLNVATEITSTTTLLSAVVTAAIAVIPVSAAFLQCKKLDAVNGLVTSTYTPAQTLALQTALGNLAASIS